MSGECPVWVGIKLEWGWMLDGLEGGTAEALGAPPRKRNRLASPPPALRDIVGQLSPRSPLFKNKIIMLPCRRAADRDTEPGSFAFQDGEQGGLPVERAPESKPPPAGEESSEDEEERRRRRAALAKRRRPGIRA